MLFGICNNASLILKTSLSAKCNSLPQRSTCTQLTMVTEECLSGEERHAEHVCRLHQQLILGLLQVLSTQATILFYRGQRFCLHIVLKQR